jgi:HAD superfamily hydrolase (TIGR01509 family)
MEIDAIAFDAFGTLFDLGDLRESFAAKVVPWMWHATAARHFRPLPEIVAAAGIDPERLKSLPAYDDVADGLDALGETPLAVLSNGTRDGLKALVENAGLTSRFHHLLSADQVERYKPAPEIYAHAANTFGAQTGRVLLVSSNEWDVAGAKLAGMAAAWVARGREPAWLLGVEADVTVADLTELAGALA